MSHPDRVAVTLANVASARAHRSGPFAPPGPGASDCRIDLKLLQFRALDAARRSPRAREHLASFAIAERPDLWAGTVQDGVARGFAVALEEAVALAPPVAAAPAPSEDPLHTTTWTGKDLRKKKDLLVKSGGARVRFSRKEGLLYRDREGDTHSTNCLRFEARRDHGTLDGFRGDEAERARIYSAQFLAPQRYVVAPGFTQLLLAGRLGRGPIGWPCEVLLTGSEDESTLRLTLRLDNRTTGWRVRARFLGIPAAAITHECTPVGEVVQSPAGAFVAITLVRACDVLLVDGNPVPVPGARCEGVLEHHFRLGGVALV